MAMICEVCGGTGCQTVSTIIVNYDEKPRHESPTRITCIWCNGTGHVIPAEVQELKDYRNAWCRCDPGERCESHVWNPRTARYDSVCETCGGFLVIG